MIFLENNSQTTFGKILIFPILFAFAFAPILNPVLVAYAEGEETAASESVPVSDPVASPSDSGQPESDPAPEFDLPKADIESPVDFGSQDGSTGDEEGTPAEEQTPADDGAPTEIVPVQSVDIVSDSTTTATTTDSESTALDTTLISATTSPYVAVMYPNGGETLNQGGTATVQWQMQNISQNLPLTHFFKLSLLAQSGTRQMVATVPISQTSYQWNIGSTTPGQYKFEVAALRNEGGGGTLSVLADDTSDDWFTIGTGTPETITVTSPNGGETWTVARTYSITWSPAHIGDHAKIEILKDLIRCPITSNCGAGPLLTTIVDSTDNDGVYDWTVPADFVPGFYKIIVTDSERALSDQSDGPFEIVAETDPTPPSDPTIRAFLEDNCEQTIEWNASVDVGGSGLAGYSFVWDAASTTIPDNNLEAGSSTLSYTTKLPTGTWYFHIKAIDGAGNTSNTVHWGPAIAPIPGCSPVTDPFVHVLYPNGGEVFSQNQGVTLRFEVQNIPDLPLTNFFRLTLIGPNATSSRQLIATVPVTASNTPALTQYSYAWNTGTLPVGQYKFEVAALRNEGGGGTLSVLADDASDDWFTIGAPEPSDLRITNVRVSDITESGTIVHWTTNLPATSRVVFDTTTHDRPSGYDSGATTTDLSTDRFGYDGTTDTEAALTTEHSIVVGGLNDDTTYYFRPFSTASATTTLFALGDEVQATTGHHHGGGGGGGGGGKAPTTTPQTCAPYLTSFIKLGAANDPDQVRKLQVFLRDYEGASTVAVTGVYDQVSYDAVQTFQRHYGSDVLGPWGITDATGYVYITTTLAINNIVCGSPTANALDLRDYSAPRLAGTPRVTPAVAPASTSTLALATTTASSSIITIPATVPTQTAAAGFLTFLAGIPWCWWLVLILLILLGLMVLKDWRDRHDRSESGPVVS